MNLLLDTHAFLWFSEDNFHLSKKAKISIEDPANNCFISTASIWEMAIKISIGKLVVKTDLNTLVEEFRDRAFDILPISVEHTFRVASLPFHHRDPFDRLLIAQTLFEEFSIISNEEVFDLYGVKRIW